MTIPTRIRQANHVLATIATYGRRFFYNDKSGAVSHFITGSEHPYFVDHYSGKAVDTTQDGRDWDGFTNGGTLRALVSALTNYIQTGEPIAAGWFGPWPDCFDLWGYGEEEMEKVRAIALKSPAVDHPSRTLIHGHGLDDPKHFFAKVIDEDGREHTLNLQAIDPEDAAGEACEAIAKRTNRVVSLDPANFSGCSDYAEAVATAESVAFMGTRYVSVWNGRRECTPETDPDFTKDFSADAAPSLVAAM